MQDADLYVGLAGIAGVFVGFGALITVRSDGPSEPLEVVPMRVMVSMAMLDDRRGPRPRDPRPL